MEKKFSLLSIVGGFLIAYFLVHIKMNEYYGGIFWGSWHGVFAPYNWILQWFDSSRIIKATTYNSWYNFTWWCGIISSIAASVGVIIDSISSFFND
jgi:hypothetical protein